MNKLTKFLYCTVLFVFISVIFSCEPTPSSVSTEEKRSILKAKFLQSKLASKPPADSGDPIVITGDDDGDGIEDALEVDTDGDGLHNHVDTDIDEDGTLNHADLDVDGDGVDNNKEDDIDADGTYNWLDDDMDSDGIPNIEDDDDNANAKPDAPDLDMTIRDINDPWQNVNLGLNLDFESEYDTTNTHKTNFFLDDYGAYAGNWLLNHHGDNITIYHDGMDAYNDSYPYHLNEEGQELGKMNLTAGGEGIMTGGDSGFRVNELYDVNYHYVLETTDPPNYGMSYIANAYTIVVNYKPTNPIPGGAIEFEYYFKQNGDTNNHISKEGGECVGFRVRTAGGGVWVEEVGNVDTSAKNQELSGH